MLVKTRRTGSICYLDSENATYGKAAYNKMKPSTMLGLIIRALFYFAGKSKGAI